MQDKLGPGNSSDKELCFENSFRELGPQAHKTGFRNKALYRCWKIADWSDWSYIHGARELPILTWPVVAANGVIVLCMVVFCLELFMLCALQQKTRVNRLCKSLQHVLPSVQRPMTDLEMFRWGSVAQALQCLESLGIQGIAMLGLRRLRFRGEAGPFDWMRTRCEAVTWNNSSGCTTQAKIKVEAISRIHDTWSRIIVLCGRYDFYFCTRIMSAWPRSVLKSDM